MRPHLRPLPRHASVLALALAVLAPAVATAQDLDTVEERVETLESEVDAATAAYEEVYAAVNAAGAELAQLETRTEELERRYEEIRAAVAVRARSVYKRGSDSVLTVLVSSDGPQGAIERASMMATLTSRDLGHIEQARALSIQVAQSRGLLTDRRAELAELQAELAERQAALEEDLGQAEVLLADLEQREARKRRIQRGAQDGTYACIFDPPFRFRDTWGAPRSGGRRHKGTDVYSTMDAPVYAFTSGTIQRVSSSALGGLGLYLWGDDGNLYYYAHLNRIADAVWVGKHVDAGEHIAHNGDSGNARGGPPHVHYQLHPGGGAPVNPYPWLAAACY